jgi:hypothetical protein
MKLYNFSLFHTLKELRPEHNWLPWKFTKAPNHYWRDKNNVKLYMDSLISEEQAQSMGTAERLMALQEASMFAAKTGSIARYFGTQFLLSKVGDESFIKLIILDISRGSNIN